MSSGRVGSSASSTSAADEVVVDLFADLKFYKPTVPASLIRYYLELSGVSIEDENIVNLVAAATDKFMIGVIYDSKQAATLRSRNEMNSSGVNVGGSGGAMSSNKKKKVESTSLDMVDLEEALAERQIFLRWRVAKKSQKSST